MKSDIPKLKRRHFVIGTAGFGSLMAIWSVYSLWSREALSLDRALIMICASYVGGALFSVVMWFAIVRRTIRGDGQSSHGPSNNRN